MPSSEAEPILTRLRRSLDQLGHDAGAPAASLLSLIGRTPCVQLSHLGSDEPRAGVVAKLEALNPGGSLKDRTALGMVLEAESRHALGPGSRIVEATAGNTGIGLALVARARGYPLTLVMPERYSNEKARICVALGADVVRLPGDCTGMRDCIEEARDVAARGAFFINQFENPANPAMHELTTGPEIAAQCPGPVDALVVGVGTGGTLTGVARFMRRAHPNLEVVAVEAQGSVIGGGPAGRTRIEGIGNSFVPLTLDRSLISSVVTVSDDDAFATARRLAAVEGILAGPSGGAIVFAALGVARRLGPGRRVVTLVPDGAERYWSKDLFERG